MKIRTKADVEALDLKIQNELGIDVKKYGNKEAVEKFVDLLIFPKFIIKWGTRPLLLALLCFFAGYFLFDLVNIEVFIYSLIGFALFLLVGVLASVMFVLWKINKDVLNVAQYSLEIMKSSLGDLKQVNHQINEENKKDVLSLLFKGIIHIVTIPLMSVVIAQKIPLLGGLVARLIKKMLTILTNVIKFEDQLTNEEVDSKDTKSARLLAYEKMVTAASKNLDQFVNITFRVLKLPIRMLLIITSLFLILFIRIIN